MRWSVYIPSLFIIGAFLSGFVVLFHDAPMSFTNIPNGKIAMFCFTVSFLAVIFTHLDREWRRLQREVNKWKESEQIAKEQIVDLKEKWRKANSDCNDQRMLNWSRNTLLDDLNRQLNSLGVKLTGVEDRCAEAETEVEFWRNKDNTDAAADIYYQLTLDHKAGCDKHGGLVQYMDYLIDVERRAYQLAEVVDIGDSDGERD